MKRSLISLLPVLVLTCGTFAFACAGSINDTVNSGISFVWNGLRTVGNAIKDTGVYLFTDDDARTAYTSTRKAAADMLISESNIGCGAKQIRKDAGDVADGAKKFTEGVRELAENGTVEDVMDALKGKEARNDTVKETLNKISDGYRQMDNDLILEALEYVPGAGQYVGVIRIVKDGVETVVGYKTAEEFKESLLRNGIKTVVGFASDAVGDKIADAVKEIGLNAVEKFTLNKIVDETIDTAGGLVEDLAAEAALSAPAA